MSQNDQIKHKKRRSFMQVMRRNKNFGEGLTEHEYSYYLQVLKTLNNGEEDEKDLLIKNFYGSLTEDEIKKVVVNQVVSKIFDETLHLAESTSVIQILKVFSEDLRIFCRDPFASHVLQTLLVLSLQKIQKQEDINNEGKDEGVVDDENIRDQFKEFMRKTSKFIFNNLSDFVCETYASHIVRSVLEVCFGIAFSSSIKGSQKAHLNHSIREDPKQVLDIPNELKEIGCSIITRLMQLPEFIEVISNSCGSIVLQSALLGSSASGDLVRTSLLVEHILEHGFESLNQSDDSIHPLFEEESTSRLMEAVISVSTEKQHSKILHNYMSEKMGELILHKFGNFSVQKLLNSWRSKDTFNELFDLVSPHMGEALSNGRSGVILSFVQACRKFKKFRLSCLEVLMSILEVEDFNSSSLTISNLLVYFVPLKTYTKLKKSQELPRPSLHGTLILQELLQFNKPIMVEKSILKMSSNELTKLAIDPRASHVFDSFASSPFIQEDSKLKLINKLQGNLPALACSIHGSRSLEALWNVSNVETRTTICQELFEASDKLRDHKIGSIIYNKFQVRFFREGERRNWEEIQEKECKKRRLLKNLLQETDEITNSAKKMKQNSAKKMKK